MPAPCPACLGSPCPRSLPWAQGCSHRWWPGQGQGHPRTVQEHLLPTSSPNTPGGGGGGLGLPQHPQGAQAPLTVRFSNFRNRFLNFPGSFCKINRGGDTHTDMSTRGEGGSGSTWGGPGHPTAPYLPGEAQAADGSVVEPDDDGVEGEHVLVLLASGEGERVRSRQGTPTHTTPPPPPAPRSHGGDLDELLEEVGTLAQ